MKSSSGFLLTRSYNVTCIPSPNSNIFVTVIANYWFLMHKYQINERKKLFTYETTKQTTSPEIFTSCGFGLVQNCAFSNGWLTLPLYQSPLPVKDPKLPAFI